MSKSTISEGLERGDLARVILPKLAIDEFKSKMGDDKDIIVIAFTVMGREPGDDLVDFIEKSYDWVLDADLSSGELSDGNYLVFVELVRSAKAVGEIYTMINDLLNLTKQKLTDWTFTYYDRKNEIAFTEENLNKKIIKSPEKYEKVVSAETNSQALDNVIAKAKERKEEEKLSEAQLRRELNSLRALANVYVQPVIVSDMPTLALQVAAGIR